MAAAANCISRSLFFKKLSHTDSVFNHGVKFLIYRMDCHRSLTSTGSTPIPPCLAASPSSCLLDDVVSISASHLTPGHPYTLVATTQMTPKLRERGVGQFVADAEGCVRVAEAGSLGGSYTGVQPMGVWTHASTEQATADPATSGQALVARGQLDTNVPFTTRLSLLPGHLSLESVASCDITIAESEVQRYYMSPDVTRVAVRDGRVRGTLFLPPGPGPHPAVLDMFGSSGGLFEYRAALLASRGVATLALAFMRFEDLPDSYMEQDLEYFAEALDFLARRDDVDPAKVGAVCLSKSVEFGLALAANFPQMRKLVAIGGVHYLWGSQLTFRGRPLPSHPYSNSGIEVTEEGAILRTWCPDIADVTSGAVFPVERNPGCDILWVGGEQDEMQTTVPCGRALQERLVAEGQGHRIRLLELSETGHIVNPPYTAHERRFWHRVFSTNVVCGGEADGHARGQLRAWREILHFLSSALHVAKL